MDNTSDNGLPTPEPSASWDLPQPENTPVPGPSIPEPQNPTEQTDIPEAASEDATPPAAPAQPEPAEQPTERIAATAPAQPPTTAPQMPYTSPPQAGGIPPIGGIPPATDVTTSNGTYQEPPGYAPPTQPGGTVPPSTPKKKTPWGWIIGCGCGCLLLIALGIGALFGGFAWLVSQDEGELKDMVSQVEEQLKEAETSPAADNNAANTTEIDGKAVSAEPGRSAALAFAENRKEGWVALLDNNSDDWHRVKVVIGPKKNDIRTWLELKWSDADGNYQLVNEGPVAQVEDGEAENVPDIYRPGPEVAIEAALVGREEWVAKVQSKTADWKNVTIYIGPPESEWVGEVKMKWDDNIDSYRVVEENALEYSN